MHKEYSLKRTKTEEYNLWDNHKIQDLQGDKQWIYLHHCNLFGTMLPEVSKQGYEAAVDF